MSVRFARDVDLVMVDMALTEQIVQDEKEMVKGSISLKRKAKDARLRREYHTTIEEADKVLEFQDKVCYICKKKYNKKGGLLILCLDHAHSSGLRRGFLCWPCNKAIAIMQDDPKRCYNAYEYLTNPPFTIVFGEPQYTAPGKIGSKKRKKLLAAFNAARTNNGAKKKAVGTMDVK